MSFSTSSIWGWSGVKVHYEKVVSVTSALALSDTRLLLFTLALRKRTDLVIRHTKYSNRFDYLSVMLPSTYLFPQ
ncbi:hypothetical protein R84B8_01564 [Treponema sp. R8-4-B8]